MSDNVSVEEIKRRIRDGFYRTFLRDTTKNDMWKYFWGIQKASSSNEADGSEVLVLNWINIIIFNMQIAEFCFGLSAVGLETGSGRAGLFIHRAGPGRACIFLQHNGPGRAEIFRAGPGRAWYFWPVQGSTRKHKIINYKNYKKTHTTSLQSLHVFCRAFWVYPS